MLFNSSFFEPSAQKPWPKFLSHFYDISLFYFFKKCGGTSFNFFLFNNNFLMFYQKLIKIFILFSLVKLVKSYQKLLF